MRWDAVLHPVGPLPAAAYWLRRAVVLGLPLLLILVVGVSLAAGGGSRHGAASRPAGTPVAVSPTALPRNAPSPGVSGSAASTPTASAAPGGTCPDSALRLSLRTRAAAYPAGSLPQLVVSVTNTGSTACARDVGVGARVITITSGEDRIWSSADCTTATPDVRTLAPGQTVALGSGWDRRRSSAGCASASPAGRLALPGLYVATATLGTLGPSAPAAFTLS